MAITAKICGINDPVAMRTAVDGGAAYVGLVFYPSSPRAVTPTQAAQWAALVPETVNRVGLFVDPTDAEIDAVRAEMSLELLQFHGNEPPERISEVKARTGVEIMKVISIADKADIACADRYLDVADWLMFDAKPPKGMVGVLPGGNALSFEWQLLGDWDGSIPWMLAGGLDVDNVSDAVALSGAAVVDISSGVEDAKGKKNPEKIRAFLGAVSRL